MGKTVRVGNLIYGKLNSVCATYPLVAENTAKFPFIIYRTTAQRPESSKDGIHEWDYTIQVDVVDTKYDSVLDLCDQTIDKLLELEESLDINIQEISENYIDDAYVKEIIINIKL